MEGIEAVIGFPALIGTSEIARKAVINCGPSKQTERSPGEWTDIRR